MKSQIKQLLGSISYKTQRYKKSFDSRAVIVMFHSVKSYNVENTLACTPKEFLNYCQFFKKYFNVIKLTELQKKINHQEDISCDLVITFDDGYLDNYTEAAPILSDLELPASFFVVTNFIESEHQAWWDKNIGVKSVWMSWDQVRELKNHGFEIGCHSANHPNFGEISLEKSKQEIVNSCHKLNEELGEIPKIFAYPYGNACHIGTTNHEYIKSQFPVCVTTIADTLTVGNDMTYLPRIAINPWYKSSYQFGYELISKFI